MWDLIVSVSDHYLSFFFDTKNAEKHFEKKKNGHSGIDVWCEHDRCTKQFHAAEQSFDTSETLYII